VLDGILAPQTIYVKRKPGFLAYDVDPTGSWSIAKQASSQPCMIQDTSAASKVAKQALKHQGEDIDVQTFVRHVCDPDVKAPSDQAAFFGSALRECLLNEKVDILLVFLSLQQVLQNLKDNVHQDSHTAWDVRLILSYANGPLAKQHAFQTQKGNVCNILSNDLVAMLQIRFDSYFSNMELNESLQLYISTGECPKDRDTAGAFASFLAFYGIPDFKTLQLAKIEYDKMSERLSGKIAPAALLAMLLPGVCTAALLRLAPIFAMES
jgi:hypothetical protein